MSTAEEMNDEIDNEEEMDDDSSIDSESSSDDENKAERIELIKQLQEKVKSNPFDYEGHKELVTLLKSSDDWQQLREARENFSKMFPLTEDLWLDWLRDEQKFNNNRQEVVELFERSLNDYHSVDIWLEYAQFMMGVLDADGLDAVRAVFERAITNVGLDVSRGILIWTAYREFEAAILAGVQASSPAEVVQDQKERLMTLFTRQIGVPLLGLEDSWDELKTFLSDDDVPDDVKRKYDKAREKLEEMRPFEENLIRADPPRSAEYSEYIAYETTRADKARLQTLYERAVRDNCLDHSWWSQYTKFIDSGLGLGELTIKTYQRGLRNCPWSSTLWDKYLKVLEKYEPDNHTKITNLYVSAIYDNNLTDATGLLSLWTSYCDYQRRRINPTLPLQDQTAVVEDVRQTFDKAVNFMTERFGADGDPECSLLKYWARLEAQRLSCMSSARLLWGRVLQSGVGSQAAPWLELIELERCFGDHKHARKSLDRALNSVTDWPETIVATYITFERQDGTLEQLEQAEEKCEKQMKRIEERRKVAAEKEVKLKESKRKSPRAPPTKQTTPTRERQAPPTKSAPPLKEVRREVIDSDGFKIPPSLPVNQLKRPAPSHEEEEPDSKRVKGATNPQTVFVSNLSYDVTSDDLQTLFSDYGQVIDVRLAADNRGKSRGFAYVEFTSQTAAEKAVGEDRRKINGRPMYISECEKRHGFTYATGLERNKLFVRGIPPTADDKQLKEVFGQHGTVKDVRIVTFKNGKSKGLAYIEYEDEATACAAVLKTDGTHIGSYQIQVMISDPPKKKIPTKEIKILPGSLGAGKKDHSDRGGRAHTLLAFQPRSLKKQETQEVKAEASGEPGSGLNNSQFRSMFLK